MSFARIAHKKKSLHTFHEHLIKHLINCKNLCRYRHRYSKYKGQIPSVDVNKCKSILVWMNMKEAFSILKYTSTIIIFKDEYSISYS